MQVQELARRFVPLKGLKAEKLKSLARSAKSIKLSRGGLLFDFGDTSPYTYYLLQGELRLTSMDGLRIAIDAEDEEAAYPVGNLLPRQVRARVRSDNAKVLRIKRGDLERVLRDNASAANQSGMSIRDLTGIPQNLLSLLGTPLFNQLPKAHAIQLFRRFKPMQCRKGQVVIREGEPGDYFYFIRSGSCRVTRQTDGRRIELNHLQALESFGEAALISGQPRSATVTMDSDGELLRLGRSHFLKLLVEPLLRHTPVEKATQQAECGRARIIDIRSEGKFAQGHLPEARNIPIYMLYLKRKSLSRQRHYIIHSDSGKQSKAAAFMLLQRGFKVSVLGKAANTPAQTIIGAMILPGAAAPLCA